MSRVVENGKLIEQVQNKCKVCGLGNIAHDFDICEYCGWEADDLQNENPNYSGGANDMSLNKYQKFMINLALRQDCEMLESVYTRKLIYQKPQEKKMEGSFP